MSKSVKDLQSVLKCDTTNDSTNYAYHSPYKMHRPSLNKA